MFNIIIIKHKNYSFALYQAPTEIVPISSMLLSGSNISNKILYFYRKDTKNVGTLLNLDKLEHKKAVSFNWDSNVFIKKFHNIYFGFFMNQKYKEIQVEEKNIQSISEKYLYKLPNNIPKFLFKNTVNFRMKKYLLLDFEVFYNAYEHLLDIEQITMYFHDYLHDKISYQ